MVLKKIDQRVSEMIIEQKTSSHGTFSPGQGNIVRFGILAYKEEEIKELIEEANTLNSRPLNEDIK
jgi:hypothetical protein